MLEAEALRDCFAAMYKRIYESARAASKAAGKRKAAEFSV